MPSEEKPYVLFVAEVIYCEILNIKTNNADFSNIDAVDGFIGTKMYKKISSGEFHDEWFKKLKENNFVDQNTKKKVPGETVKLLRIQKDIIIKQLIQFPDLYYAKSHYPLEISQRAFDHLWRMCESYELWCKETKQENLILLKIID
jgi:Fe-S cluster biosynthesis and repair protein YggX|tara:strand:+ start:735 stop:1172 length:438 start_codon:yes stop_codon:yes gene_type:complete